MLLWLHRINGKVVVAEMDASEWELLLESIACCQIGEESYYRRHLHKQAINKNKTAMALVAAQESYAEIIRNICHQLQILQSFGHETIKTVCDVVIAMDECSLEIVHMWTLCAITGAMCYQCINIELKSTPQISVHIDSKFKNFLQCIWILFHLEKIQNSRICEVLKEDNHDEKKSISDKVAYFLKTKSKETKKLTLNLVTCQEYVQKSLQSSLDEIQLRANRDTNSII